MIVRQSVWAMKKMTGRRKAAPWTCSQICSATDNIAGQSDALARRAYGRLHAGDRQQELFLVVAARLADGQGCRHRVRGDRGASGPAGDAADDPQALALGARAGAAASRPRGVGIAGDRRIPQRPQARGGPVAGGGGGARPCPLDLDRDACGLFRAARQDADEHPRVLPGQGHDVRGARRDRAHHLDVARLPQALCRRVPQGRRLPVRAFHRSRRHVRTGGDAAENLRRADRFRYRRLLQGGAGLPADEGMGRCRQERALADRKLRAEVDVASDMMADIVRPLALAGSLLGRFWPQLLLIGALGYIARDLLLNAAVAVGLKNALGGMVVLSLVVLTKLMVVVLMFGALRPGMPALASLRQEASGAGGGDRPATGDHMLAVTAAAILPFFAYYAAWGFLGDTVREYSRLALQRVPFGERLNIFNFVQSQGMLASIAACWAIRWFAKRMNARA